MWMCVPGSQTLSIVRLQNFITRDDIIAYAEEGGDFAQLKEVDACMEVSRWFRVA